MRNQKLDELLAFGIAYMSQVSTWIDAGTLLGLYRDGKHIDHDTDLDFGVIVDKKKVKQITIKPDLNMLPVRGVHWKNYPMQHCYLRNEELLDFYFFYTDLIPGFLVNINDNGVLKVPLELIVPVTPTNLRDMTLPAPGALEQYLVWRYGSDWQTPKKQKDPWQLDHPNLTAAQEDFMSTLFRDWEPADRRIKENFSLNSLSPLSYREPSQIEGLEVTFNKPLLELALSGIAKSYENLLLRLHNMVEASSQNEKYKLLEHTYNNSLEEHAKILDERTKIIQEMEASRSWRWTKWLRR